MGLRPPDRVLLHVPRITDMANEDGEAYPETPEDDRRCFMKLVNMGHDYHERTKALVDTCEEIEGCDASRYDLEAVPLVHGVGLGRHSASGRAEILKQILDNRCLWTRSRRGKKPTVAEAFFELEPCVYFSTGVLYPERSVGIVLTKAIEQGMDVAATPFDTGTLYKLEDRGDFDRKSFLEEYQLPSPFYRRFFSAYIAHSYARVMDFLRGAPPDRCHDLVSVFAEKASPTHGFEVRITGDVRLSPPEGFFALVVPEGADEENESLAEVLDALEDKGVRIAYYNRLEDLSDLSKEKANDRENTAAIVVKDIVLETLSTTDQESREEP